jgi:hypothetical protein
MRGSSKHNAYRLPSFAKNGYPMLEPTGSTEYLNDKEGPHDQSLPNLRPVRIRQEQPQVLEMQQTR